MGDEMKQKPKHADVIHAWADGADIEWKMSHQTTWQDIAHPNWKDTCDYRIKPMPKPDVVKIFYLESHPFLGLRFSEEINPIQDKTKRISCTFDGETGHLKTAEVVG